MATAKGKSIEEQKAAMKAGDTVYEALDEDTLKISSLVMREYTENREVLMTRKAKLEAQLTEIDVQLAKLDEFGA